MGGTEKTLFNHYEEYYEAASFVPQQRDGGEVELFAAIAGSDGKALDILDIGCAEGRLSVSLAVKGHRVTAADISQTFLAQTAKLAKEKGVAVSTVFFDVEKDTAALGGKTFDLVYLMDVIEHLRSPASGLANVRSLLKENGTLVIHTPNLCSLGKLYRYVKFRKKRENYFLPASVGDFHLQGYDYQTLEKALNFTGLQIVEILPTAVSLPLLYRFAWLKPFSRWLSKHFPFISDTLLVKCVKTAPIDVDEVIGAWREKYK